MKHTKETYEKLIEQHKSTYEIAKDLKLSQTTVRYWLKKYNLKTNCKPGIKLGFNFNCVVCKKATVNGRQYCSLSCNNKQYYANNSEKYFNKLNNSKYLRVCFKLEALEYCGKSCKHCGYNKNYATLAFHHIDSSKKDFALGSIRSKTLKDHHKKELDECITLCHNCHSEEHYKLEKTSNKLPNKQAIKGAKVRRKLIELKGGKCNHCNLQSEINSLYAFHHIDPNTKEFNIDARVCNGYKYERLLKEADKCILLCHNCHSEHHNPECVLQ